MSIGNKNFKEYRRESLLRAMKEGHSETTVNQRNRGTTTALALRFISQAMLNPGQAIPLQDHSVTEMGRQLLHSYIFLALDNLELTGFTIKRNSLTYDLEYVYEQR